MSQGSSLAGRAVVAFISSALVACNGQFDVYVMAFEGSSVPHARLE